MTFLAVPFPDCIAFGAERSPRWATTLHMTAGGYAITNERWAGSTHDYDVSLAVRGLDDYELVKQHHHVVRGRANSFPFKDFADFAADADEGVAVLVTGSTYQMGKVYGGTNAYTRTITRPVSGTCTFYRFRDPDTTIITPTVDYDTGRFAVTGHVSGDVYSWAGEFRVPCRYQSDSLPAVAVNKSPGANGQLLMRVDSILLFEDRE